MAKGPKTIRRHVVLCDGVATKRGRLWAFGYDDLAKLFGISPGTARQWVNRGHIDPSNLEAVCEMWKLKADIKAAIEMRPEYDLSGGERGKYVDRYNNATLREITHHPHCDGRSCDCADYPINNATLGDPICPPLGYHDNDNATLHEERAMRLAAENPVTLEEAVTANPELAAKLGIRKPWGKPWNGD